LLWTLYTVHGSAPNVSDIDRRFMINSYVRAADSDRGEWAFRGGVSTPLGAEPEICKYEQLRERPGPFLHRVRLDRGSGHGGRLKGSR
jgi:phytanoyl-CoA hydroxylase